ncbi:MAG: TPM domain-containing protein [bacterium]|nr:TPM domain-containing protein [bacterium]
MTQDVAQNDGFVTDRAEFLTAAQETTLEELMESYRSGTGHEIALLTVQNLGGDSLEHLALETARAWGLGSEDTSDGALILIAKAERKIRIETGRGLEGSLTDAIAGRIIRNVMQPRFRAGDYYSGILEGVKATHAAIGGDYGPLENHERKDPGDPAKALLALGIFALIAMAAIRGGGGRGGGRRRGSPWMWTGGGVGGAGGYMTGGFGGFGGSGGGGGGGFSGFGGGGGFSGGGASGGW